MNWKEIKIWAKL